MATFSSFFAIDRDNFLAFSRTCEVSDKQMPSDSIAETNPIWHRDIGCGLVNVAKAMNSEIGPLETSRMLFSLWLSFMAQHSLPLATAAFLRDVANEIERDAPRSHQC
jgi:hypothetical protein